MKDKIEQEYEIPPGSIAANFDAEKNRFVRPAAEVEQEYGLPPGSLTGRVLPDAPQAKPVEHEGAMATKLTPSEKAAGMVVSNWPGPRPAAQTKTAAMTPAEYEAFTSAMAKGVTIDAVSIDELPTNATESIAKFEGLTRVPPEVQAAYEKLGPQMVDDAALMMRKATEQDFLVARAPSLVEKNRCRVCGKIDPETSSRFAQVPGVCGDCVKKIQTDTQRDLVTRCRELRDQLANMTRCNELSCGGLKNLGEENAELRRLNAKFEEHLDFSIKVVCFLSLVVCCLLVVVACLVNEVTK